MNDDMVDERAMSISNNDTFHTMDFGREKSYAEKVKAIADIIIRGNVSSSESRANRLSRAVSEQVWFNRAEEIVKSEIGQEEYNKRLEKQNKLFEEGAKKGGFFDGPSMYFTKGSIKSLFEKKTKASGLRATHHAGVGALGYAVIDNDPRIPKNDFFAPGRVFEIRARHSNFPNADNDAKMGNRSLSLKFADHETESPLDFILQTGYISPFFNAESIEAFHSALQKGNEAVKGYFTSLPVYLEASLEGLRYLPDSYYHQFYHSQMVYDFKSSDDVRRVARFRVVPADGSKESGRLSPEEQREVWYSLKMRDIESVEEEINTSWPLGLQELWLLDRMEQDQPSDYLREEFKKRINQTSALDYSLQMQIHEFKEGDTNIWYNASLPWDSETHPWIPLATIVLETLLPEDVVEVTRFNVGHTPKQVLDFPEATSNADFNTVPNIRKEVYELASKLRPREPREPARGESVEYLIHTVTGTHPNAGNMEQHSNVYVSIIGSEGRTPFMKLTRKFKGDFDKGNTTTFGIISKRVGELRCAKVFKERKGSKSDWFLEYMVISTPYNNKCHTLPCYRWFNEKVPIICLRDGTGVLDHMEPDHYMRLMRTQEITLRQMVFQWRDQSLDPDFEGLPGYLAAGDDVHALPNDMWTPEMKKLDTEWQKHLAGKNSLVKQITNLFKGRKGTISAEFEETVADSIAKKDEKYHNMEYIIRHWRDDAEFARQMVNGLNPMKITALTSMPATFPLKEHAVKGLLEPGRTLQQELQAGRLFLISYPELEEFVNNEIETEGNVGASSASVAASRESMAEDPYARSFEDISEDNTENMTEEERKEAEKRAKERKKEEDKRKKEEEKKRKEKEKSKKKIPMTERRKYLCAPMLILYLKGGTEITPLAIQLTQTPEDPSHPLIYTPNDNNGEYSDWMVAKMWVRVADSNLHQVSVHLLGTHLMIEPIAIATVRQLPSVHPVFKLLVPFLKKIVAINTIYRKWVMPKDGAISEVLALCSHGEEGHLDLMKKQINRSKFSLLNVPNNFSARGVLDESCLPGFYYRDDVLKLWAAIQDYVTEILALYYEEDEDVEKDDELASMIDDLRTNGFNNKVELPGQFVTLEELVNFCTIVIFRCTGQHAAVSRGMLDIYGYCPNAPPCMMKPFPTYKRPSGWTEVEMKELLPPIEMMERYIGMVMLLFGGYDDPEVSVGKVVEQLFTEEAAMVAIKHFQDKLAKISKEIHVRNENIDCPYTYLLPENIPSFIDI